MPASLYAQYRSALLMIDLHNDFMSEVGKLYDRIKGSGERVGMFRNLRRIQAMVPGADTPVFILPDPRSYPGDFDHWQHMKLVQKSSWEAQIFPAGSWGGEWHPEVGPKDGDITIREHCAQSSFADTDFDAQPQAAGYSKINLVVLVADTCIEPTGRQGIEMEIGSRATLVRDATAAFSTECLHTVDEIIDPTFAHPIVADEVFLVQLLG